MNGLIFPEWVNKLRPIVASMLLMGPIYLVFLIDYGASPQTTDVGYQPTQPIPFSHKLHAGDLKMDCRYCHNTVEESAHAAIPPSSTCMNCHKSIYKDSEKLQPLFESVAENRPIPWRRVHDLPDHVYFNHAAHIRSGVGCASCHGRVDQMEVVFQDKPLSMSWCLECHRNPEPHLRPKNAVTDMTWVPLEDQAELGKRLRKAHNINPSTDCSTCHR